MSEEIRYR